MGKIHPVSQILRSYADNKEASQGVEDGERVKDVDIPLVVVTVVDGDVHTLGDDFHKVIQRHRQQHQSERIVHFVHHFIAKVIALFQ